MPARGQTFLPGFRFPAQLLIEYLLVQCVQFRVAQGGKVVRQGGGSSQDDQGKHQEYRKHFLHVFISSI